MEPENLTNNKWLVIINPNAGKRKAEKDWPVISGLLRDAGFEFDPFFTQRRGHAMEMTEEKIRDEGYRQLIIVGGDGTLNEAVNGIFRQNRFQTTDIVIGMIMVGTGNDWGRMYQLQEKYGNAVETIKKRRIFIQDAGLVKFYDQDRECERYFVNMAGLGYDALVAEMTNQMKDRGGGGTMAYLLNLLKGLFRYNHSFLEVEIDGESVYKGPVFSMSVGICKYNGGGMMQLPFAIPDDGLFDVTLFKKVTKMTVVRNLKKLYAGTFTDLPFVLTFRGKSISVVSTTRSRSSLETDGESLGQSPFRFEIYPQSVKVITDSNWNKDPGEPAGMEDNP